MIWSLTAGRIRDIRLLSARAWRPQTHVEQECGVGDPHSRVWVGGPRNSGADYTREKSGFVQIAGISIHFISQNLIFLLHYISFMLFFNFTCRSASDLYVR